MSASEPQSVEVNKGHLGIRNFNERRILTLIRREHALPKAAIAKQTQKQPAWEKTTKKDNDPLSEIEPFLSVAPMYMVSDTNLELN